MQGPAPSVLRVVVAVVAALGLHGCGPDPLPDAADCAGGWQEIVGWQPEDVAREIQRQDDVLYLGVLDTVTALPASGGALSVVVPGGASRYWVESSQIVFGSGGRLSAAPLTGGAAAPLLDGGGAAGAAVGPTNQDLGSEHFYWVTPGDPVNPGVPASPRAWTLWRLARQAGAVPEAVATITASFDLQILTVGADSVLVADADTDFNNVYVVSTIDGSVHWVAGFDAGFVIGWNGTRELIWAMDEGTTLWRISVGPDDTYQRFWTGKSRDLAVLSRAWPDGRGGWIFAGLEPFADGATHTSIWSVSTRGDGVRLACSPASAGEVLFSSDERAVGADAVWGVVSRFQTETGWTVVRVPR